MISKTYFNILHWLQIHQLPCVIKKLFLIECPGCGLQRSILALLQGRVWESIKLYPALIFTIIFFITVFANNKYAFLNGKKLIKFGVPFIFILILGFYFIKLTIKHF